MTAPTRNAPRRCLDASEPPDPHDVAGPPIDIPPHTDAHLRGVLLAACGPGGAWPRLPQSARHDPATWSACRRWEAEGMLEATGDVRGDRTQFLATDTGRAFCAFVLAIRSPREPPRDPPGGPGSAPPAPREGTVPKPRVRAMGAARSVAPPNPTAPRAGGTA